MNDAQQLAAWVPPGILSAMALGAIGIVWRVLSGKGADLINEVKAIRLELTNMDKKLGAFATTESLGNMGNRFDGRLQALLERVVLAEKDIAIMREVIAKNEMRAEKRRR